MGGVCGRWANARAVLANMNNQHEVGDTVQYIFNGEARHAVITAIHGAGIKGGRAWFVGKNTDGQGVWGYCDEIEVIGKDSNAKSKTI